MLKMTGIGLTLLGTTKIAGAQSTKSDTYMKSVTPDQAEYAENGNIGYAIGTQNSPVASETMSEISEKVMGGKEGSVGIAKPSGDADTYGYAMRWEGDAPEVEIYQGPNLRKFENAPAEARNEVQRKAEQRARWEIASFISDGGETNAR